MVFINNTNKGNIIVNIDTSDTENITFVNNNKSNIRVDFKDAGIVIPKSSASRIFLSLYSSTIPISFYSIRSGKNQFILKEDTTDILITIPEGHYNVKTLASTVSSLLTSLSPNNLTYTIVYSSIKNKFFISHTVVLYDVALIFASNDTPYIQMGFNVGSTNIIEAIGSFSHNQISVYDTFSIYLKSSLVSGQGAYLNGSRNNIIERIPISSFGSIATYLASPSQNRFMMGESISTIDLQLCYDDDTLVDLQGLNWQVSLMFTFSTDLKILQNDEITRGKFENPDNMTGLAPSSNNYPSINPTRLMEIIAQQQEAAAASNVENL